MNTAADQSLTTPIGKLVHASTEVSAYTRQRALVEHYFDRTAAQTWARLTSDAPVSKIRATVRAGRDQMRELIMSWLPQDMTGWRVLDAGCGTGSLACLAAQRGAQVLAIDLSATLLKIAAERLPNHIRLLDERYAFNAPDQRAGVCFMSGDLLDERLGTFDAVVSMDCLIHYSLADTEKVLACLAQRTRKTIIFTFAPSNPFLEAFRAVGKFFPQGDRSPAIKPVVEQRLRKTIQDNSVTNTWALARTKRVKSGFYTSQALEVNHHLGMPK
jgi:magnesium-protoporphyrin O-methyltransferase